MCVYISVGANSQNFACTGTLVTGVKNFPAARGVVLGLLKGFVGLRGAVMAQIYLALYGDDSTSLILLIAWLPAAMSVLFAYTIRELDPTRSRQPRDEVRVFYHFLYISIALALFLMAINIAQKLLAFSPAAYAGSATVVCAILFFPLAVAIREELALWNANNDKKAPPPPDSDKIKRQKLALLGFSDKVLAEFITDMGRRCSTVEQFDAVLKESGADESKRANETQMQC